MDTLIAIEMGFDWAERPAQERLMLILPSWGVVYAGGSLNCLFHKSIEPYVTTEQIADFFQASKSMLRQKASLIRDMFKMQPFFNTEFATRRMIEQNPFARMAVIDGFVVPMG